MLVANLGTPDGHDFWSMRRYLREFLSDRRVIDYPRWKWWPILNLIILTKRPFTSGAAYRSIWNKQEDESPLLTITRSQAQKLRENLGEDYGEQVRLSFGMRYGNPGIDVALARLHERGCRRILFFPLYPQYAGATTGTANDQFFRYLMTMKWQPAIRTVPAYFEEPALLDLIASKIRQSCEAGERHPEALVISYHGLPVRYLVEGDPYHCQCQKTTRLLRDRLRWPETRVVTTFQSRFGREEWLKPYTVEEVRCLAKGGLRSIAVVAPGFAADCVETLEEIQGEIREAFLEAGGEHFHYIPCLNDDDDHINVLAEVIRRNLGGWI